MTPVPFGGTNNSEVGQAHFLDNLDSFDRPHSCDGEDDPQMDELNRLVMVAEINAPFDLIFSGSSRDRSQSFKTGYVTPAPSGGEMERPNLSDSGSTGAPSALSLDVFDKIENTCVDTAAACDESIDSQADNLDLFSNECVPREGQSEHDKPVWLSQSMIILGKASRRVPRHLNTKSPHGYVSDVPSIVNSEMWHNF